jgi:hypothetical protein
VKHTQITYRNRLAIEVLEAQELRPIVSGKTENVFCKIYMKCESNSKFPPFGKVSKRFSILFYMSFILTAAIPSF